MNRRDAVTQRREGFFARINRMDRIGFREAVKQLARLSYASNRGRFPDPENPVNPVQIFCFPSWRFWRPGG